MEEKKIVHWRRWVLLALMILGFIAAGVLPPVSPEITVAPEKLIEEPITLPLLGQIYFVNTLPPLFVAVVLIAVLAYFTNRSMKRSGETDLVPRGVGNAMEAIFEMIYNLTESSAGTKWAPRIFPWFATILFYVLIVNLIRLIPGFESIGILRHATGEGFGAAPLGATNWFIQVPPKVESGGFVLVPFARGPSLDLNFTFALALISVVMTQVIGFRALGAGYLSKFFNFTTMFKTPFFGAMDFLVGLLELISELAKILSFAFRLFFNMFAGAILVAVVAVLLARLTIVSGMLYMFELFVGLIQAFVFGMLTMVFMSNAIKGHGHEEEHTPVGAEAHEI